MLHVGGHVRVRRAERGVAGRHGSGRQADQGDVGDDGAAGQTCMSEGERRMRDYNVKQARPDPHITSDALAASGQGEFRVTETRRAVVWRGTSLIWRDATELLEDETDRRPEVDTSVSLLRYLVSAFTKFFKFLQNYHNVWKYVITSSQDRILHLPQCISFICLVGRRSGHVTLHCGTDPHKEMFLLSEPLVVFVWFIDLLF